MQRLILGIVITVLATTATGAAAAELDSASVASALSYGYARETDASMQSQLELVPAFDMTLSPATSLIASGRIRLDAHDALEPGRPSYDTFAAASKPINLGNTGSVELRDLYLEFQSDSGLTRLGKQQIVWGRLDGIKVLDLVNPQDFREFIIDDFGNSRIGLWSAYFDYSLGNWRTEIALVPDATGHAIPDSGSFFELTAPRFRFGAMQGEGTLPVATVRPELSLRDMAVGLRMSRQFNAIEFSAVAYTGMDPEPLGRIASRGGEPVVERFYERRDAIGFSFDLGLGSAVLRAEYAYQPKRVFNTRSNDQLTTLSLDQHRGAIGLDIDGPLGIFVNIQYLVDSVADAPAELARPATDQVGTLYLRRAFAYDSLALEARWYHSFTDEDQLASVGFEYTLSDSTSLELSAQFFSGAAEGLFGQFTDRDRITLSLSHIF